MYFFNMRKSKFWLAGLFFVLTIASNAQNYQSIDEVNDACSQLGFSSDEDAQIAVDNILEVLGLYRNFSIQQCPNINNAIAKNIDIGSGHKERFILYDKNFFNRIEDKAENNWAAVSILAHEIGHHLNGHALNDEGSSHKWELEADEFSGFVLKRMGSTLVDAQSAISTLKLEKATRTHPAKADRLEAIEKGWVNAGGISGPDSDLALENYINGEQAYGEHNFEAAKEFFEKSRDYGNVDAYYYLSNMYYVGLGVTIDSKKAYEYAKTGYDLGSIPSTFQLGKYLSIGVGTPIDAVQASRLFQKDFQVNWFKDQYKQRRVAFHAYTVGYMYNNGYGGVTKDLDIALFWYKQAAASNDLIAQYNLGVMFNNGDGVAKDPNEALSWYQKAADGGLSISYYGLGQMYFLGNGVSKDYKEALKWFQMAADVGNAQAQSKLGYMYFEGVAVPQDYKQSLFWTLKAAKQGNSMAQHNMGINYANGLGATKDYKEALKWFQLAADQNYTNSQFMIGVMYENGFGVSKDYSQVRYWFGKAAENGETEAQFRLGVLYHQGQGGAKDFTTGMHWIEMSAANGNDQAQYFLGYIHIKGEGVKKNKKLAIEWFRKSARQGNESAQKALKKLNKGW
jgi:TPR repeat protein